MLYSTLQPRPIIVNTVVCMPHLQGTLCFGWWQTLWGMCHCRFYLPQARGPQIQLYAVKIWTDAWKTSQRRVTICINNFKETMVSSLFKIFVHNSDSLQTTMMHQSAEHAHYTAPVGTRHKSSHSRSSHSKKWSGCRSFGSSEKNKSLKIHCRDTTMFPDLTVRIGAGKIQCNCFTKWRF